LLLSLLLLLPLLKNDEDEVQESLEDDDERLPNQFSRLKPSLLEHEMPPASLAEESAYARRRSRKRSARSIIVKMINETMPTAMKNPVMPLTPISVPNSPAARMSTPAHSSRNPQGAFIDHSGWI